MSLPCFADVLTAAERIAPYAHQTPVMTSRYLDGLVGAQLYFKCESFQKVGAFKFRGACNAVLALSAADAARGVVTHSSGNHGQAVALASRMRGISAVVVMPDDTSPVKHAAVMGYGARIERCAPGTASREAATRVVIATTGASLIHPYDDAFVIAGQGTAALELLQVVPGLDALIAPVGGGGLLSGTCLAAHGVMPRLAVYGAEPATADDARQSLAAGRIVTIPPPRTVADGLRSSALGELTFAILRAHAERVLVVDEAEIVAAMRLVWERLKILIEPSSAVPVAALLRAENRALFAGRRVGVILSGGNVDLDALPWLVVR